MNVILDTENDHQPDRLRSFLSKVVHVVHTWYKIYFTEQKLNNDQT